MCVHSGPVVGSSRVRAAFRSVRGLLWAHRLGRRVINSSVSSGRSDSTVETQALVTKLGDPHTVRSSTGSCRRTSQFSSHPPYWRPPCACKMTGRLIPTGPRTLPRRLLRCKRSGAFFPQVKERRRHSGVSKESAEPREMHRAPLRKCRQHLQGSAPHLPAVATPNRTPLVAASTLFVLGATALNRATRQQTSCRSRFGNNLMP